MNGFVDSLGLALLNSLWQGALVGAGLAGLLRVLRRPVSRYGAACAALVLTLTLTLVVSVTGFQPAVPAVFSRGKAAPLQTVPLQVVSTEAPTFAASGPAATHAEALSGQKGIGAPTPSSSGAAGSAFAAATRALSLRRLLEPLLPLLSLLWALGVLLLSLRLAFSLRLLRRYRTRGVTPAPEALGERLDALAQSFGLRGPVRLLQTRLLDTPAAVGVFRPVVLLPASVVSGLTAAQLELVLAHELAHVRRRDPLVNLLQTVAETLLFYHPAAWWASRVMRGEREHICDDLALEATGGDRLAYAEVLGRLERSRAPLPAARFTTLLTTLFTPFSTPFSTKATGSLLPRVRRLLGLKADPPSPGWAASLAGLALGGFGVLALSLAYAQVVAPPQRVSSAPNVFGADVAVDPADPDRLAVAVDRASQGACEEYLCTPFSLLYTSTDGGATWREGSPYGALVAGSQSSVAFAPGGPLYAAGVLGSRNVIMPRAFINRADEGLVMDRFGGGRELLTETSVAPTLAADPRTNTLYAAYLTYYTVYTDGNEGDIVPELFVKRSSGDEWSAPVRVFGGPSEASAGRTFLADPQVLIGREGAVVVMAEDEEEAAATTLWLAVSRDGGESFAPPIAVSRDGAAYEAAASADGALYVLEQGLEGAFTLLRSPDNGETWEASAVGQDAPGLASFYKSFALGVSPEGVIDVAYYVARESGPACFGAYREQTGVPVDPCSYDLLYSSSRDGVAFSAPQKLNLLPVSGEALVRFEGVSFVGNGVAVASTDAQALVSWVGAFEEGTQAFLTRVSR